MLMLWKFSMIPFPGTMGTSQLTGGRKLTEILVYCVGVSAKRIVGAQGNYKKWGPYCRLCEEALGARPWKILRFYTL